MDNIILADFLANKVFPALKKDGSFWIDSVRNKTLVGSHQWRNLAQIIIGGCARAGINYNNYVNYCARQGNFCLTF